MGERILIFVSLLLVGYALAFSEPAFNEEVHEQLIVRLSITVSPGRYILSFRGRLQLMQKVVC